MDSIAYLAPAFRPDPLAVEWSQYLADHCLWHVDDFGGGYAWETSVPPRSEWETEVGALNAHLASEESRP